MSDAEANKVFEEPVKLVIDGREIEVGSSATNRDSDGDTLSDWAEVNVVDGVGPDPNDPDTDDDGLVEVRVGPFYFDGREPAPGVGPFLRGDCGQAGSLNISSGIFLLGFLFSGGGDPGCFAACDADGDGQLDAEERDEMRKAFQRERGRP